MKPTQQHTCQSRSTPTHIQSFGKSAVPRTTGTKW